MYRATVTDIPLATEGYYFSPHPFTQSDTIESQQLAIMLGTNAESDSEVIMVAQSQSQDGRQFQLAIVGQLDVLDREGQPLAIDRLRELPVDQLSEAKMQANGWTLRSRPYFIWRRENQPLSHTRSSTIYCSIHHQLRTLSKAV